MPWPDEHVGAVVFDMDGVLVDSTALHREVWEEFVADCPWPALRQRAGRATGRRAQDVLTEVLDGELSDDEIGSIVAGLHDSFLRKSARRRLLFPEAERIVAAATAVVPTALATSAPAATMRALLGDVADHFTAVVTSEDCAAGKPDPEIYLRACAALGVAPERAVAIEDAAAGVISAVAAGCGAWGVTAESAGGLLALGAAVVVPDLAVLGEHLLDLLPVGAPTHS